MLFLHCNLPEKGQPDTIEPDVKIPVARPGPFGYGVLAREGAAPMQGEARTRDGVLTLSGFYLLMEGVAAVRRRLTLAVLNGGEPSRADIRTLETALEELERLPQQEGRFQVAVKSGAGPDKSGTDRAGTDWLGLDLEYEIGELAKDLTYLRDGEDALVGYMAASLPELASEVETLAEYVGEEYYACFFTDRDGTVNNYCGHYRSSIQSIYNAVFLTRFSATHCKRAVMLTSAPLASANNGGGLTDVNVMPMGRYILAGSKGREFVDLNGRRGAYPVEPDKEALLMLLNSRLQKILREPGMEIFGMIGSGLQFKFGQTTLARQDVNKSISPDRSRALLSRVSDLLRHLDPAGTMLRIEDTGLDIEIILTVQGESGLKDFDKGDAVTFLDSMLNLDMATGPNLVCGDTCSDLPMLAAAIKRCRQTKSIFVTTDPDLREKVRKLLPGAAFASSPDVLVTCLGVYA